MTVTGFFPGSFDPVHRGHLDIVARALGLVDTLVIGVGVHDGKKPLFPAEERIKLLEDGVAVLAEKAGKKFAIVPFDNLAVDAARENGAQIIIRGLRDSADYNYEARMDGMNAEMAPGLETVFFNASPQTRHIAASLIRQIAEMGGDVTHFVPENVAEALQKKFGT